MSKGWHGDSAKHSLAARGIKIKAKRIKTLREREAEKKGEKLKPLFTESQLDKIVADIEATDKKEQRENREFERKVEGEYSRLPSGTDDEMNSILYGSFGFGEVVIGEDEEFFWKVIPSGFGSLRMISRPMLDENKNPIYITIEVVYKGSKPIPSSFETTIRIREVQSKYNEETKTLKYAFLERGEKVYKYSSSRDTFDRSRLSIFDVKNHEKEFGNRDIVLNDVEGKKTTGQVSDAEAFILENKEGSNLLFKKAAPALAMKQEMLRFNNKVNEAIDKKIEEGEFLSIRVANFLGPNNDFNMKVNNDFRRSK